MFVAAPIGRIAAVALAPLAACVLMLIAPPPSHASKKCGSIIVPSYEVRVKKGDIGCSNARKVMKKYMNDYPSDPRGWRCKPERAFHNPLLLPGRLATCGKKNANDKVLLVGTQAPGPNE